MAIRIAARLERAIDAFNKHGKDHAKTTAYIAHRVAADYPRDKWEKIFNKLVFENDLKAQNFVSYLERNYQEKLSNIYPLATKEQLSKHNYTISQERYVKEDSCSLPAGIHRFGGGTNIGKTHVATNDTNPQIAIGSLNSGLRADASRFNNRNFISHETATPNEMWKAEFLTCNYASLHKNRGSTYSRFETVYLQESHKTLQDSVMSKLHAGNENEYVLQKLIVECPKVIATGPPLYKFELDFWERFNKPFHYYHYTVKTAAGKKLYWCSSENQLYEHAFQALKDGKRIYWATNLSNSIGKIKNVFEKKFPNKRIVAISKQNAKDYPLHLLDKNIPNEDIDVFAISPLGGYGNDIVSKFDFKIGHFVVGSKPTDAEQDWQSFNRERAIEAEFEGAAYVVGGGKTPSTIEASQGNPYDLPDPITGEALADTLGLRSRFNGAHHLIYGLKEAKPMAFRAKATDAGYEWHDSPYPIKSKSISTSPNWRSQVLSAPRLSPSDRLKQTGTAASKALEKACLALQIPYPEKPDEDQYDFYLQGGTANKRHGREYLEFTKDQIEDMKSATDEAINRKAIIAEVLQKFVEEVAKTMKGQIPNNLLVQLPIWQDHIYTDKFLNLLRLNNMAEVADQKSKNGSSLENKPYLWFPMLLAQFGIYAKSVKHDKSRRKLVSVAINELKANRTINAKYQEYKSWVGRTDKYSYATFNQFLTNMFLLNDNFWPKDMLTFIYEVLAYWDQEMLIIDNNYNNQKQQFVSTSNQTDTEDTLGSQVISPSESCYLQTQ